MSFDSSQAFDLPLLPPSLNIADQSLFDILLKARTELAELNGAVIALPNPMLLLSPAIVKESLASSEIENIHTTLEEALQNQLFPESEQRNPDKEVLRYREALLWGYAQLPNLPISTRLILGIHQQLLSSGGEFRKQQNQIANTVTKEIIYTPPIAANIPALIGNWENFVNDDTQKIDPLIRAAIAHYQFEAIHPFTDGNGRTGRILMVLSLVQDKLLHLPVLYISGFINKNRAEYYRLLRAITTDADWYSFIKFFLHAFHQQALETKKMLFAVFMLYQKFLDQIKASHPKIYSADLVQQLFSYPILTPVSLGEKLDIHYTTASRHLHTLAEGGYLKSSKVGKYHFFINHQLMTILS